MASNIGVLELYIDESGNFPYDDYEDGTLISCGVHQLYAITDLKDTDEAQLEKNVAVIWLHCQRGAFVIYSDIVKRGGDVLTRYLRKHKLGEITTSPIRVNPNTGNRIRLYTFIPNKPKLTKFVQSRFLEKAKEWYDRRPKNDWRW